MAVNLRKFEAGDYEEVVKMHYQFTKTIYPSRKLGHIMYFYAAVKEWIEAGKHLFVTEKDGILTGYSLSSVDYNNGLTEAVYFGEIVYVKPEYRKGKSAYLLYNNAVSIADEIGLKVISSAFNSSDNVEKIQSKFGSKVIFTIMERG